MRKLLLALAAAFASATPASAQWRLEAQAGQMRNALDPANTELQSFMIGVRYDEFESALRISAGIPTTSTQSLWGSIAGSHRLATRKSGFVVGVDLSGNALGLQDRVERTREVTDVFNQPRLVPAPAQSGFAAALQALPVVGFEASRMQAHARAGVSHHTSKFGEQSSDRTVKIAELQLSFSPTNRIAIMPVARHYVADDGDFTFVGMGGVTGTNAWSVWASTGRWTQLEDQDLTWAAGANVRVHERVSLMASGRTDVLDPLYALPPQTSWSVGVAVQLGRPAGANIPVPAVFDAGNATIRLRASETGVSAPRIAGDFTSWKPQPMRREGDVWVYSTKLAPGVYNFAFVDGSGGWFVPAKYPGRKRDGMGGEVAVLVVR